MKEYMDTITKSMDEYMDTITKSMDEQHSHDPPAHSQAGRFGRVAAQSRASCVDQLTDAVAELQQGRLPAAAALGVALQGSSTTDPLLAAAGTPPGVEPTAQGRPHGSNDHRHAFLHREQVLVVTAVPLPGIGQLPTSPSTIPISTPFSHTGS